MHKPKPQRSWLLIGFAAIVLLLGVGTAAVLLPLPLRLSPNQPPTVRILAPSEGAFLQDRRVVFRGEASDPDGRIVRYEWLFDDGVRRPVQLESPKSSLSFEQIRVYGEGGERRVTLRAIDDRGAERQTTITFRLNRVPVARISAEPTYGEAPLTVRFDGSDAQDLDGKIIAYAWDFDGDGRVDAEGMRTQHTFVKPGVYPVTLVVTDDLGARSPLTPSATLLITVHSPSSQAGSLTTKKIPIVDFESCSVERWTNAQGQREYHVNLSPSSTSPLNPYLVWERVNGSPPLTKSGAFAHPAEKAWSREHCTGEADGKALRLDYDVTTPGSYAGFFLWLNKGEPTLQRVITEYERYALRLRLKGNSGRVKIELKLPGLGWLYAYQPITVDWQEYTIPLREFTLLENWPPRKRLEFTLVLENRILEEQKRQGTIYLDDLAFVRFEEDETSAR